MKNFIFLYYISTHTCHIKVTEAADQKWFIKEAVLKNVWKIHKKSPVGRFFFRSWGWSKLYRIFLWVFPNFSEQLTLDKIVFKERRLLSWLKSGDFIHRRIFSAFPLYLEWAKSSIRTTLRNTKEHLLLEVAAM